MTDSSKLVLGDYGVHCIKPEKEERLTWKEIKEKYPCQWVHMKDVINDDSWNIKSAIVVEAGIPDNEVDKIRWGVGGKNGHRTEHTNRGIFYYKRALDRGVVIELLD